MTDDSQQLGCVSREDRSGVKATSKHRVGGAGAAAATAEMNTQRKQKTNRVGLDENYFDSSAVILYRWKFMFWTTTVRSRNPYLRLLETVLWGFFIRQACSSDRSSMMFRFSGKANKRI